ncbi:MAG: OmpH family outer membrane protein [Hyphomonadaceae bacterium]
MKSLAAAAALMAAPLMAGEAMAQQAGSVIVISAERLLTESTGGRDMAQRLQAIQQQMQTELNPEQTWLQQEEQALAQATQGQTPDQVRANQTLARRIETFNQRAQAFRIRQATAARDFDYTRAQAVNEFNRLAGPIVQEVMSARSAAIVLDRGMALSANASVDATEDVMSRLNERVRTVNVTRQSAPVQAQSQQQ